MTLLSTLGFVFFFFWVCLQLLLHGNYYFILLLFTFAIFYLSESDSTECHLVEIVETFTSEIRCCTSQYGFDITDLIYMRIFYVKDLMDHWDSQDCIQSGLNRGLDSVIAFSLIPVDGLEMENTIMLFSCFLQKSRKKS